MLANKVSNSSLWLRPILKGLVRRPEKKEDRLRGALMSCGGILAILFFAFADNHCRAAAR